MRMLSPDPSYRQTMREAQVFFDSIRRGQPAMTSSTREASVIAPPPALWRTSTADAGATARAPPARAPEQAPGGSDGGGSAYLAPVSAPVAVGTADGAHHTPKLPTIEEEPLHLPPPPLPLRFHVSSPQQMKSKDLSVTRERGLHAKSMGCLGGGDVAPAPACVRFSDLVEYVTQGKPQEEYRQTVPNALKWGWGFDGPSTRDEHNSKVDRAADQADRCSGDSAVWVAGAGGLATEGVTARVHQNIGGGCAAPFKHQTQRGFKSCLTQDGNIGATTFTAFPTQDATIPDRYGALPCSKASVTPLGADIGGAPAYHASSPEMMGFGRMRGDYGGGYNGFDVCGVSSSAAVSPSRAESIWLAGERSPPGMYSPQNPTGDGGRTREDARL